jgi:C4-dicarboxylate-specific signal transduction histidine kinase
VIGEINKLTIQLLFASVTCLIGVLAVWLKMYALVFVLCGVVCFMLSQILRSFDVQKKEKQVIEDELKQTKAMIETLQQKIIDSAKMSVVGEMAGGIAHEINNPLAIISGKAQILSMKLESDPQNLQAFQEGLKTISVTIERTARIVKGLRSLSRNASHDEFKPANICDLINEVIELCRYKFSMQMVRTVVVCDKHIEANCRAVEISQVLMNLLSNSFDAIKDLQERWVEICVYEGKDTITFNITDSGAGIPKEVADKIMQPFFTTKEVGKGTGLGLSIAKKIVESHGGSFTLDPSHKNTRFVIEIPKIARQNVLPFVLKTELGLFLLSFHLRRFHM